MPTSDVRAELLRAAAESLRPIVRRLLGHGVPFGLLEARLRELYVQIVEQDLALPGRRQTDSRVSLVTGINRKEVRRIRSEAPRAERPVSFGRNQGASLVSRWLGDRRATDGAGNPRPLPYQAPKGVSFVSLAQQVTVDLPPRAILDELVRTGAATVLPDGRVALDADSYVPKRGRPEKLAMLSTDPAELTETMLQNIFAEDGDPWLQRKVYYDNVGSDGTPKARAQVRKAAERFLRAMDRLLARYDRDRNPRAPGGERRTAGIGVYYFESSPRSAAGTPRRQKERKR
jgi:hypothetical protein